MSKSTSASAAAHAAAPKGQADGSPRPTPVFFSPTRSTAAVVRAVARGLSPASARECDLTLPDAQTPTFDGPATGKGPEVAIIGVPVYGGRVPALAAERLARVQGNGTPAVLVVVYGNRAFEDALLELRDIAVASGFRPVAGGAFIGEHSFSSETTPVAVGRPDEADLELAASLGARAAARLAALGADGLSSLPPLDVPGDTPYKARKDRSPVGPEVDTEACTGCCACAEVCPTGAIDAKDATRSDP
jgi:NAD-dependent dihydropyrimidine dehydrogenase PreA subunit/NAD(P)H-dependent FMN reductase